MFKFLKVIIPTTIVITSGIFIYKRAPMAKPELANVLKKPIIPISFPTVDVYLSEDTEFYWKKDKDIFKTVHRHKFSLRSCSEICTSSSDGNGYRYIVDQEYPKSSIISQETIFPKYFRTVLPKGTLVQSTKLTTTELTTDLSVTFKNDSQMYAAPGTIIFCNNEKYISITDELPFKVAFQWWLCMPNRYGGCNMPLC
jgi:hypothetical protein